MLQQLNVKFRWLLSYYIKTKIMGRKVHENTDLKLISVSENFIVVDKQSDIVINSEEPDVYPVTVATMLNYNFPHLYDDSIKFGFRFCHRLDFSTSGILCIALNKKAAKAAFDSIYSRSAKKYYLALVYGHIEADLLTIDKPIGADSRPEFSHCMCSSDKEYCVSPRSAVTRVLVLQRGWYGEKPATKVLLELVTGRRHQIRVHCHELGHTIVGDFTYSNRKDINPYRMFLHAYKLFMPTKLENIDIVTEDPFSERDPRNKWSPSETVNELNTDAFSKL